MCQCAGDFRPGGHASRHGCCCMPFHRSFRSSKEEQELLNKYRDQLEKEIEGVEEHLKRFKNK